MDVKQMPKSISETITYVPGMREQGESIKFYVDSEYAPLVTRVYK